MIDRHERGRRAEQVVADYLHGLGYRVIGRNVRVGSLEVDIVATLPPVLAVVEVRSRSSRGRHSAVESVTSVKRRRLRHAASVLWASRFSRFPELERVRFDVAAVTIADDDTWKLDYIEAAFV